MPPNHGLTVIWANEVFWMGRGQGATEYLVLLAVVLIVALVSIALLGFFPGMASDTRITQSQSYWREARPFAIIESDVSAVGTGGSLVIQNMDANGHLLTNISIAGIPLTTNPATPVFFASGGTNPISFSCAVLGGSAGTSGAVYDFNVTLTYDTPNGITGVKEYGTKNLVGKYR